MKQISLAIVVSLAWALSLAPATAQVTKPDVIVLIAIDQFGTALFNRWRSTTSKGLRRLADEGILYSNAYQSHGITETCAGHSTLLTGKHPSHTGIVANEWYDTAAGKEVYCVTDPRFVQANRPQARKVGPALLATDTLGDWMKAQQPKARVVSVSCKDRASIVMGGHNADAVFWCEDNFGFTTFLAEGENSAAKLAPLAELNAKIQADAQSVPPWTYANESCRALEADYQLGDLTWHSKLPPEVPQKTGAPPAKVRPVHILDPLTAQAARELVAYYQLGKRGVTDLLAVSFSATDFVGHGYGTQGPEMCDHVHRLDALLGEFLTFLENLNSRVLVVVTGDHGSSDFTERLALQGFASARRIDRKAFLDGVNADLKAKLSLAADPLVSPDMAQFYVVGEDRKAMSEPMRSQVIAAAVDLLKARSEVEDAFTLTDLLKHKVVASAQSDYSFRDRFSQSVMQGRSGDIIVAYKSGVSLAPVLPTRFMMGHAGPYAHDAAVPIIFWWPGVKPQTRLLPVDTTSIAPTLANVAGIKPPDDLDGPCLDIGYPGAQRCAR